MDERLSAALDNELPAEECQEIVDELFSTPEMQRIWERQHTISALLRKEPVNKLTSVNWHGHYASYADQASNDRPPAKLFKFDVLKEQFTVKIIGGMALAASLVLAVSMVVVINDPMTPSMQTNLVDTTQPTQLPTQLVDTKPTITPSNNVNNVPNLRQNSSTPDVYFVSDQANGQRVNPEARTDRNPVPRPTESPNRDLVRLVTDKPQR